MAVLYYAAARLGLLLSFEKTNASPIWPPSGIAFAAVLLRGYRIWPGILLGAFLANVVVFSHNQFTGPWIVFVVSILIATGNTLEALVGSFLLRRLTSHPNILDRTENVFKFVTVALMMCLTSSCIGPTALCVAGMVPWNLYAKICFTWWLGDTAGVLVVTPLILAWSRPSRLVRDMPWIAEAVACVGLVCAVSWITFGAWPFPQAAHFPLVFLTMALLLWPAFRFSQHGATTALFLVSGIAVWKTIHGYGPFVQKTLHESLLLLVVFSAVVTTTVLAITALLTERRKAEEGLKKAHEGLEARIQEQTADLRRTTQSLLVEIDEHKEAKKGLSLLADMVKNVPMGLVVLRFDNLDDPTTLRIISMNDAGGQILGLVPKEVIGNKVSQFWPAFFKTELPGIYLQVIRSNQIREVDDFHYPDDRPVKGFFHIKIFPLPNQYLGLAFENVTEKRKAGEVLREKSEELARSNQELSQFASVASHDLQEPLRKILAFSDLLRKRLDGSIDPESQDYLQRMQRSAERMEKLIEDLLVLARVITKAKPLEKVELTAAAQEALSDLEAVISRSGGQVEVAGSLPQVNADPQQMRQLLQNLIANAIKFRKKDESPRVKVSGQNMNNGFCEIAVEDNGIGFEEQYLDRIFKPFQRLHSRLEYEGSGIGLAICDKIVMRHGGTISAKSSPGRGSRFTVRLPTPYGVPLGSPSILRNS